MKKITYCLVVFFTVQGLLGKDKIYPKGLPPGYKLEGRIASLDTEKVYTFYYLEKGTAYLDEEIVHLCSPKRNLYVQYYRKTRQVSVKYIQIPNPDFIPCPPMDDECRTTYLTEPEWLEIGKSYYYHPNGKLKMEFCHDTVPRIDHQEKRRYYHCYDEKSELTPKCTLECTDSILLMQTGKYLARQNTGVYAAPNSSSRQLFLLKKDETAEVMETRISLHKLNTENAFLVKVKVKGVEGYLDCTHLSGAK